ncbi:MAG: N-acetylmuramoyl-L-alanine amidase [Planctomycetes bacterium]|nr:N-acetylmuramoyl-L-alanine amidase [Planctomycetota bacterium]
MKLSFLHYRLLAAAALVLILLLARCTSAPAIRDGHTLEVCGQRFPIATRVVNWRESRGYDAYREGKFFDRSEPPDGKRRYGVRANLPEAIAANVRANGLGLDDLRRVVHQFVLHYDIAGCSRQCFKVLQDVRNLSVHFLLDVDGTIYQTLDLREKAQHATIANDFSIGVEIAHPGAYPQPMNATMAVWYEKDAQGWRQRFPGWLKETGILTPDFVIRPARPEIVSGTVQGKTYHQLDFTEQQYAALARLCAALSEVFPRIRLEAPRDQNGEVVDHALPEAELRAFDGIVGHFHVQTNKQDPGPAFQWNRVLGEARRLRGR